MNLLTKRIVIGNYSFAVVGLIWFLLAFVSAGFQVMKGSGSINNYNIYTGAFHHLISQENLYSLYPSQYQDSNHYGPVFGILIAPFALLPDKVGAILWCMVSAWVLFYAINKLSFKENEKAIVLFIALLELLTAIHNMQFNIMLAGWMLLSYVLVKNGNLFWAAMFIAAGTLIKLYGIIGVSFIFFTDKKWRFILYGIFWLVVLFLLPAVVSNLSFVVESYKEWYSSLVQKNTLNEAVQLGSYMQDISVMGMVRRILNQPGISNLLILIPAAIGCLLPLLRKSLFRNGQFQLLYLSLLMIATVIYSTSAESSTYIIVAVAVGIWYIASSFINTKWKSTLLIVFLLVCSIGTTDLMPHFIQHNLIRPYSLKALPALLIWCAILYELWYSKFEVRLV